MASRRKLTVALLLAAVIVLAAVYAVCDPASGYAPKCMLKVLTGYDCPGCGAQRALHALLHGDIAAAWGYNPALFFLIPLAMVYGSAELLGVRCRVTDWLYKPWLLWLLALGIIAWWILRNV